MLASPEPTQLLDMSHSLFHEIYEYLYCYFPYLCCCRPNGVWDCSMRCAKGPAASWPTGPGRLGLPCRRPVANNHQVAVILSDRSRTMGMLEKEPDVDAVKETDAQDLRARLLAVVCLATTP